MKKTTNYDKQPTIQISNDSSGCLVGWTAVAYAIQRCICSERKKVVVAECYPGVHLDEVLRGLSHAGFAQAVCTEELFKSPSSLLQMLEPCLGDDPVFGRIGAYALSDFFDMEKVANARNQIIQASDAVLVYGPGAAFIAEQWDHLIYCDVVRWEIQQRQRQGSVGNLGAQNCGDPPSRLYKRSYFVDWRVCDIEKHRLYGLFSFYIDTNREQYPVMIAGRDYRNALWEVTRRPFRLVPFFDPGPWGGEWMRTRFGLPDGPPNFAWCFDCVPEENSLRFGFGDEVVEVPAINLVHEFPEGLLGSHVLEQFGAEFPIRFDLLDTFGGGNLSLQVHPLRSYIAEHFGMKYTQDESYYMLDAEPDAVVYLGLREGIDANCMAADLEAAQSDEAVFPVEQYVNAFPVRKHDHVSIPAGTVHCSGKNSMVLEISATPYIFTFKLWDWGRLGMNGQPRPIHLGHGLANIQWDRDRRWVKQNLINPLQEIASGDGWREEKTGLHELEFLETRRHWFTSPVDHDTEGTVNVLNLIEGEQAIVESPDHSFEPFTVHYAETFVVPASVSRYRISPVGRSDQPWATIKAYIRKDFTW